MARERTDSRIESLLRAARAGDASQLGHLFEACRSYLTILARGHVEAWMQPKVDASDIIQETLLEAHRDFARFQGTTAAEWLCWLRGILTNNAADVVRRYRGTEKRQARREIPMRRSSDASSFGGVSEPADSSETPSVRLMREERELAVADAMVQLPPDHQQVLILRNLQRLPFNDVARRMGRSRPAVQMLWMRAVRKLQEILPSDV